MVWRDQYFLLVCLFILPLMLSERVETGEGGERKRGGRGEGRQTGRLTDGQTDPTDRMAISQPCQLN